MYLDDIKFEFKVKSRHISKTISHAKTKKRKETLQSLRMICEEELQGKSCSAFTAPFLDHPLHDRIVFLIQALQHPKGSYRKILYCLRKALVHPAYVRDRASQSHPFIHLLHTLCLASYASPPLLGFYRQIGDHLAHLTAARYKGKRASLHQFFSDSRAVAKTAGLTDNDYTLWYALKHPRELISALSSKSWGKGLTYFNQFDPKGFAGNTPGAFFEEKFSFQESNSLITARTIYSPTPSLGEEIAPEAKAMLQAMENYHSLSPKLLQQEPHPYLAWVYVNLQDLTSRSERARSLSLMRLTEQYPHSFYAITVTQDAGLYRDEERGCMKKQMLQNLLDEDNFTLEGGKTGYCFPCRSLEDKEQWKKALRAIVCIASEEKFQTDRETQGVVFCELVTLGIVRYFHLRCAAILSEAQAGDIRYLVTNACKESIDRGGKINALLLLGKGKREAEVIQAAFSCLHARALSVRERLIKKERMEQACTLLSVVPHDTLQLFFNKIDALVHIFRSEVHLL